MKSKNLVYTSFGDNTSFDSLWLEDNRNYDVWATYYGDNDQRYNNIYCVVVDVWKYTPFRNTNTTVR